MAGEIPVIAWWLPLTHDIAGVGGVPDAYQVRGRFADVLPIDDLAPVSAASVQRFGQGGVRAVADLEFAIQVYFGRICPQSFKLHGASLPVKGDRRVAQFQQHLADAALVQAGAAGDKIHQMVYRLLLSS